MSRSFPDALVTGYESLVDGMTNHPKDRHVLAAAVRANAEVIVTFNLRDFPEPALKPYDIAAIHPDDFLLDQLAVGPRCGSGGWPSQAPRRRTTLRAWPLNSVVVFENFVSAGVGAKRSLRRHRE
jgi:hypothetical protein